MPTLVGKVQSLSVTPNGGAAIPITGARIATITKNFGAQEDYDPDDPVPFHYQGNPSETVAITLRDYALAVALWEMPCISAMTLVLKAPRSLCATTDTSAITVEGTNLVVDGDIAINAAPDGLPTEYTVTFKVSHVEGVAGGLTVT